MGGAATSAGPWGGEEVAPVRLLLTFAMSAAQGLSLPRFFSSHMVLQRAPAVASVWGQSIAGGKVQLWLDDVQRATVVVNTTGYWKLAIPPQSASKGHTLVVTDSGSNVTFTDVAFGDVFLCSGQSHMQFSVNQDLEGATAIASSALYPGIRMLTLADNVQTEPAFDVPSPLGGGWLVSMPASFGVANFSFPSAICYYTARELYEHQNGTVPMGIISSSVGGSAIRFWSSDRARADETCGGRVAALGPACSGLSSSPPWLPSSHDGWSRGHVPTVPSPAAAGWSDGCFWNGMIAPLAPMQLAAILWDQGEANDGDDCITYGCKLASLAHDWRVAFGQPSLPFLFDQLRADDGAAGMGAPAYAASVIPHASFASRVDLQTCLPSNTSEGHAIRKLEVGRRLALALRVVLYNEAPTTLSFGPSIVGASAQPALARGGGTATGLLNITVHLAHAEGLHHADAPECEGCCKGHGGELIAGTPLTGDAWSVTLIDGSERVVCRDASLGCDGQAHVLAGCVSFLVDAAASLAAAAAKGQPVIHAVEYGGRGPWVPQDTMSTSTAALQCVYPHAARYGIEACALYNGKGGYDDHKGIAMAAQAWYATV